MSYESVDLIIDGWVKKHAFTPFNEPGRSVYLSSDKGECFQIWIDPPVSNEITLHAGGIETQNEEEVQMDWKVPVNEFANALDHAVACVRLWFAR